MFNIYNTHIPRAGKVAESSSEGQSIFSYDKNSKVAIAYRDFAKEVMLDGEKEHSRSTSVQSR